MNYLIDYINDISYFIHFNKSLFRFKDLSLSSEDDEVKEIATVMEAYKEPEDRYLTIDSFMN